MATEPSGAAAAELQLLPQDDDQVQDADDVGLDDVDDRREQGEQLAADLEISARADPARADLGGAA